jgi:hypothetical protein
MSLILMDWGFGSEIRRDLDFLRSLRNCLNSSYALFLKDFTFRGRSGWIFQFFPFAVSSSISDRPIRTMARFGARKSHWSQLLIILKFFLNLGFQIFPRCRIVLYQKYADKNPQKADRR